MRFLPSEHKAFREIIESSLYEYTSFSFVKKKGWLTISQESIPSTFRFHRKEESTLDSNGKWSEQKTYFIEIEKRIKELQQFNEVIADFKRWLETSQ